MKKKKTLPGTILAILLIGFLVYSQTKKGNDDGGASEAPESRGNQPSTPDFRETAEPAQAETIRCRCTRVVDGDTIVVEINRKSERVRLVGVNTPESVDPRREVAWFGKESAAYTKRMLEGQPVELQFKPDEKRDNHGRMLAFVHLDGNDFCARLIRDGYAYSFRRYPHPRLAEYNRLEREARAARRGLWENHPDFR